MITRVYFWNRETSPVFCFDLFSELYYGDKVFLLKLHLVDKITDSALEAFGDTTKNKAESNLKL